MKTKRRLISVIVSVLLVTGMIGIPDTVQAAQTAAIDISKITVTNNADTQRDVIYITSGTKSGDVIRLYDSTGKRVYQSGAAKTTSFRIEIPSNILDDSGGTIDITIDSAGSALTESDKATLSYSAAPQSLPAKPENVVATDNDQSGGLNIYDKVNVTGLRSGDVFCVYYEDPWSGGTKDSSILPICKSNIAGTKGMAEATPRTPFPDTGIIWITVKSTGRTESNSIQINTTALDNTRETPVTATATNVFGSNDKVMVTGVYTSDTIQVYEGTSSSDLGTLYGTGKVPSRKTDIEIFARANKTGLLPEGGSIMVKITTPGKKSIFAGPFTYEAEGKTPSISDSPGPVFDGNKTTQGDVTIYNYEGKVDQIEIQNLRPGDVIYITTNYQAPQKDVALKTVTVGKNSDFIKSSIQLPAIPAGSQSASIKIYVTSVGFERSDPVIIEYGVSASSDIPQVTSDAGITGVAIRAVTNSAIKGKDEILISGVQRGDQVFVYESPTPPTDGVTKEKKLNTESSGQMNGKGDSFVVYSQFPTSTAGKVYVSFLRPGLQESDRVEVNYGPEIQSTVGTISFSAINNAGDKDVFHVYDAPKDTIITIYTEDGQDYSSTAIKGGYLKVKDASKPQQIVFPFPALPAGSLPGSGTLYVGVTLLGQSESALVAVPYDPEPTQAWDTGKIDINVMNNFGPADYVEFSQVVNPSSLASTADMVGADMSSTVDQYPGHTLATSKTIITIYTSTDPAIRTKAGSLTLNTKFISVPGPGAGEVTISRVISAKGLNPDGGTIAYTITHPGKAESERIALQYGPEPDSDISGSGITVINNINTGGILDYVSVSFSDAVTVGATIRVYSSDLPGTSAISKGLVTEKMIKSSDTAILVSLTGKNLLPDNTSGGSLWVSIQEAGKKESDRLEVTYGPAVANQTPSPTIVAVDNKGMNVKDSIFVYGLSPNDTVVLTYTVGTKNYTNTSRVAAGQSSLTINSALIDAAWEANNGQITVTRPGMTESAPQYLYDLRVPGYGY